MDRIVSSPLGLLLSLGLYLKRFGSHEFFRKVLFSSCTSARSPSVERNVSARARHCSKNWLQLGTAAAW